MKKTFALSLMVLCAAGLFANGQKEASSPEAAAVHPPKYVFYMIGDGLGAAQRQVAEYYLQHKTGNDSARLVIDTMPVSGINTTYSADTLVTDSAAAATALASGAKTNNGMIGELPSGAVLKTLVEAAEEKGMGTGLISTTRLTHATPACFAAHNPDRNDENGIAADFTDSGVDFFAGGGARHFISNTDPARYGATDAVGHAMKSKRTDGVDVVAEFAAQGYNTFIGSQGARDFVSYTPRGEEQVFAAFTYTHNPYELDRVNQGYECPSLAAMTEKGGRGSFSVRRGVLPDGGRRTD